jgi:hypothetical protein
MASRRYVQDTPAADYRPVPPYDARLSRPSLTAAKSVRSAGRVPDVTSMGDQLIEIAKAEVRAWRWEWGPALLFAFILADGVARWDPMFSVPWLLVAAVLFFVARGARRGQANGARGRSQL